MDKATAQQVITNLRQILTDAERIHGYGLKDHNADRVLGDCLQSFTDPMPIEAFGSPATEFTEAAVRAIRECFREL